MADNEAKPSNKPPLNVHKLCKGVARTDSAAKSCLNDLGLLSITYALTCLKGSGITPDRIRDLFASLNPPNDSEQGE